MLDYQTHARALDDVEKALATATFTDPPLIAAQSQTATDLQAAPGHALLGTFIDHLFEHAVSDGAEISLVERAAHLWDRGLDLCNEIGAIRGAFEASLANPGDPGSAAAFNNASIKSQKLANDVLSMADDVTKLTADIVPLTFMRVHPRQTDTPASSWDWASLLLGRRTDAFVRSLAKFANDEATRAFAFGALAGYGANAAGSAYLGHVVGGSRRAHRFRDRLARVTIGSWFAANHPGSPTPGALAKTLRFGNAKSPKLPSAIDKLVRNALSDTFDLSTLPPAPDLNVGYRRLVEHLTLLDGFVMPSAPEPPNAYWSATIYADPANPPPSLRTQDLPLSGDDGGGVSVGTNSAGNQQPGNDDSNAISTICGIICAILIIVDLFQAFVQCCVQWAKGQTCTFWDNMILKKLWEKDPPDPRDQQPVTDPGMTGSMLTTAAGAPQIAQVIAALYDMHVQVWEAMDRAHAYLSLTGLIYPAARISLPRYSQFTKVPAPTSWPHRPVIDPENTYQLYPSSAVEQPARTASPYPVGATPDIFAGASISHWNAAGVALSTWRQIAEGVVDSPNLDLDADRGYDHPCWATGKSINDNPVDVIVLAYADQ